MSKRDSHGMTDGLEASITVPEGEEHLVEGLARLSDELPTEPQPKDVGFEVRNVSRLGFGVFVVTQEAPLTLGNVTWFPSAEDAEQAVADARESFGWQWTPATYGRKTVTVTNPNTGEPEEREEPDRAIVVAEGSWSHSYGLLFDPASLKELLT